MQSRLFGPLCALAYQESLTLKRKDSKVIHQLGEHAMTYSALSKITKVKKVNFHDELKAAEMPVDLCIGNQTMLIMGGGGTVTIKT